MKTTRRFALFVFVLLLFVAAAQAQNITGSIAGVVTDASGAVLSGATVTVTNTDTGVTIRTVKTGSSGEYSAPLLPIGNYSISVSAPGFKTFSQTGVTVNVNDKLTINAALQVGATEERIVVEANPVEVELQSPTASGLVNGTQIRQLSLNNRNYEQLVTLVPGVSSTASSQLYVGAFNPLGANVVSFSINGARTSENNWTIDGADNVDRGANLTLLSFPSVDAIAEFKVLRGQYDAEFGRSAGAQINVVTRSGTSTFHGGAYEFFRNDVLNANNFFNKRTAPITKRPALRYNNFGWTLGGPVYIPGVYNKERKKTFFFASQEFRRVITYSNPVATVPTQNERNGIFAHSVCTTWSGTTCTATGTTIPVGSFSPTAAAYLKDIYANIPFPNDPSDPHTLRGNYRNVFNFREDMIKIDHVFSQKLTVNGKILRDDIPTEEPGGVFTALPLPGIATTTTNSPGHNYTLQSTITVAPTVLINAGYGYSYGAIVSRLHGLELSSRSPDIKPTMPFPNTQGRIPQISFQSATLTGISVQTAPYDDFNFNHNAFGNVTKVSGRHTIKAGLSYNHYRKTENAGGGPQGTFTFNNSGIPTGTSNVEQNWANFLTGHVVTFTQTNLDLTPDIRANQIEMFGQDEFRFRPNLTISVGLRYSMFRQPTDANGLLNNFDPHRYDPSKQPCIGLDGNIDPTCGPGSTAGVTNFDPLNGIVYQGKGPFGNKVANEDNKDFAPRIGFAWDPWSKGKTSIRAGYGIFYDAILFGIAEQNMFSNPPTVTTVTIQNTNFDNPGSTAPAVSLSPKRLSSRMATPYHSPYSQQWSLDFQQDVGHGFLLDVGYYGAKGTHLIGIMDVNQPLPGAYLTQIRQCGGAITTNCVAPGAFITSGTTPLLNRIRPYKGYVGIDTIQSIFNSNYNSLQVQAQKRFTGNSLFSIVYTWSHNLTDNGSDRSNAPQNTYCIHCDYGASPLDRRHIFTASYVYNLPFFRDQKGVVGHVLGGWEVSGVVSAQTGSPFTVTTSSSIDPAGGGCLGPSPCAVRPDQIADPMAGAPRTIDQWFNKAAFVNVPAGQFRNGTTPRSSVYGPGSWNVNFSAFKNIKITERVGTQFRLETFNTFNHTNPVCCGSFALGNSLFDKITSTGDPRIIQLALKLNF